MANPCGLEKRGCGTWWHHGGESSLNPAPTWGEASQIWANHYETPNRQTIEAIKQKPSLKRTFVLNFLSLPLCHEASPNESHSHYVHFHWLVFFPNPSEKYE